MIITGMNIYEHCIYIYMFDKPSGKLLHKNQWKDPPFQGKIHYLQLGHAQYLQYVKLPEGTWT